MYPRGTKQFFNCPYRVREGFLEELIAKLCLDVSNETGKQKRKGEGPFKEREQLVQRLRRKQADTAEYEWEG